MGTTITTGTLATGGAIVEASDKKCYAVFVNSTGDLVVYDDVFGSLALGDSDTPATVHGAGAAIALVHACIDGNDLIHIVSSPAVKDDRDVAYATYTISTSTIGTWEQAANYLEGATPWAEIAVDGSNYPYIAYRDTEKVKGNTAGHIYVVDKTGASWSTPEIGDDETAPFSMLWAGFALGPSDTLHIYWVDALGDVRYRTRTSGVWGTPGQYTSSVGHDDVWVSLITVTSGGTVYRVWQEYIGAGNYRVYENDVETRSSPEITYLGEPSATILDGSDRYIFFCENVSNDIYLFRNTGAGWANIGALEVGTYFRVLTTFNYHNPPTCANYLFASSTTVYAGQYDCPIVRRIFITHV